jgi:hypothetical protein
MIYYDVSVFRLIFLGFRDLILLSPETWNRAITCKIAAIASRIISCQKWIHEFIHVGSVSLRP